MFITALLALLTIGLFSFREELDALLPKTKDASVNVDLKAVMNPALFGASIAAKSFGKEAVITSARDGIHKRQSKHDTGEAFDLRRVDWPNFENNEAVMRQAKIIESTVGENFDVIVERDHIHVEFDPETGVA